MTNNFIIVIISGLGTMAMLSKSERFKQITFAVIGITLVIFGIQQFKKA